MAVDHIVEAAETGQYDLALKQPGNLTSVKGVTLAVTAFCILAGFVGVLFEARLGLLLSAFLFGWTQLVGL